MLNFNQLRMSFLNGLGWLRVEAVPLRSYGCSTPAPWRAKRAPTESPKHENSRKTFHISRILKEFQGFSKDVALKGS